MVVPKVPFSFIVKAIAVSYTGVVLGTIGAIMGLVLDLISPREIEENDQKSPKRQFGTFSL